jgi:hypothetical protein
MARRNRRARRIALRCAACGEGYGDPLYHGPAGHAPAQLCLDCWLGSWDRQVRRMHCGGPLDRHEEALALLCEGYTYRQAGDRLEVTASTVRRWVRWIGRTRRELPEWFRRRLEQRRQVHHVR